MGLGAGAPEREAGITVFSSHTFTGETPAAAKREPAARQAAHSRSKWNCPRDIMAEPPGKYASIISPLRRGAPAGRTDRRKRLSYGARLRGGFGKLRNEPNLGARLLIRLR